VSVNDVLKDVLALLDHQLRDSQVTVKLDLDPSNPRILGNRNQLKQVFINLMMNAIHAMEQDPRLMEVGSSLKDGLVLASIRDSGIGIPKENISRIFEPFFSTKSSGTGLGLSISYGLVKDHKGAMEVESLEGRGTTFTVTLPKLADEAMGYNLLVG
jgi:signal transduction histidine kinase